MRNNNFDLSRAVEELLPCSDQHTLNDVITVIKKNFYGQETWRYQGEILARTQEEVVLEAFFDRADMSLEGLPLRRGDRFVETYFFNRWYNIYAIYSHSDGTLSGWYCNITRPAELDGDQLSYIDLALDLIVFPDGKQVVLDEDEFAALPFTQDERQAARQALDELQSRFVNNEVFTSKS